MFKRLERETCGRWAGETGFQNIWERHGIPKYHMDSTNTVYRTTNVDAGVGIGLLRGELIEKAIN